MNASKEPDPVDDSLAQGPGFVRRTLSSLRWRNFRLFFIGQTISQTGNWLTNIALTLEDVPFAVELRDGGPGVMFRQARA